MFRAALRVVSEKSTPEELTGLLGMPPDDTRRIGERRHSWSPPSAVNVWKRELRSAIAEPRVEDLCAALEEWDIEAARQLGELTRKGLATVQLSVLQEITDVDDPQERGIVLTPGAVRWLGIAGASIGIDQYFLADGTAGDDE